MNKININQDVFDLTPQEFKDLDDVDYRLIKIESFRDGFVDVGQFEVGTLGIINVQGLPSARVQGHGFSAYLRTSPIVTVLDKTDISVTFETEGGVYRIEKV